MPTEGSTRGRKVDLVGRTFDHVEAIRGRRLQRQHPHVRYCRPSAYRVRRQPTPWAISAVVVDLPFVPVMAMKGEPGATTRRSRAKSSMSPTISTLAWRASSTHQCGLGWVSGTPGDSTRQPNAVQSASRRSTRPMPRAAARSRVSGLSSQGRDVRAAGQKRHGGRHARAAKPEQGDLLAGKSVDGDHDT